MRYQELLENTDQIKEDHVLDLIKNEGMQWLKETRGVPLYRGTKYNDTFIIKKYRTNRRPVTSKVMHQVAFDEYLKDHGATALRSNSVFITPDYDLANSYSSNSEPHVFIALGNYHYTFISHIYDLFITLGNMRNIVMDDESITINNIGLSKDDINRIKKYYSNITIDPNSHEFLKKVLLLNQDLIVNKYEFNEFLVEYMMKYLKDNYNYLLNVDKNLQEAIDTGSEIIVNGDRYLLVSPEFYENKVLPLLGKN